MVAAKRSHCFWLREAPLLLVLAMACAATCRAGRCVPRVTPPDSPPEHATAYNGIALPDVCFEGGEEDVLRFFTISDWGGIPYGGGPPVPADNRGQSGRPFVKGVDDQAQQRVAAQMAATAARHPPRFVLNAGDMFYWNGLEVQCGLSMMSVTDPKEQLSKAFEDIYTGEALKNVPWLGTLGNHDFGGRTYVRGWDQIIAYTWGTGGRWVTPALYFRQRVHHADFTADFFMVDTNICDVYDLGTHNYSNICGASEEFTSCGANGPSSAEDCVVWFNNLWANQLAWLEQELYQSTAVSNWQVVVTHFPPEGAWQLDTWRRLSEMYGIDLMVTGHRHQQEVHPAGTRQLGDTAYVVSGGGGGITSEGTPSVDGHDDQYGFMDMEMSKTELKIYAVSHSGVLRSTTVVEPRIGSHTATSTTTTTASSTATSTTSTSSSSTVTSTSTTTSITSTSTSTATSITTSTITSTNTSVTASTVTATITSSSCTKPPSDSPIVSPSKDASKAFQHSGCSVIMAVLLLQGSL